jgi:hypothetical protein
MYFYVLWTFRSSNEARFFLGLLFFQELQNEKKKHMRGARGSNETRWHGPLARPCHPSLFGHHASDVVRLRPRLIVLALKVLYKDPLRCSLEEVVEKDETTKQRLNLRRMEGETLPEPSPITSPTSPTSPTLPPWWRGSSPPLEYGFVAVAWSISLLCYID